MYITSMVIMLRPLGASAGPYANIWSAAREACLLFIDNNELDFADLESAATSSVAPFAALFFGAYAFLVVVMLLNV